MRLILLLFLLFSSTAFAGDWGSGDRWTTGDTVRQLVYTGLTLADWNQTRKFLKHNEDTKSCNAFGNVDPCVFYSETNPILGPHPTQGRLNVLVGAAIIGHAAISYLLPPDWRHGWQYIWIGIEGTMVYQNHAATPSQGNGVAVGLKLPL